MCIRDRVLAVGLRDGHAGAGVVVQFLVNGLEHAPFPEKIRQVLSGGVAGVLHERKLELSILLAPGIPVSYTHLEDAHDFLQQVARTREVQAVGGDQPAFRGIRNLLQTQSRQDRCV